MKKLFCLFVVASVSLVGCRKKEAQVPESPASSDASAVAVETAPSPVSPVPPPPGTPVAEAPPTEPMPDIKDNLPTAANDASLAPGAVHQPLTLALHRYFESRNQMPQNFQQLVAAKFIDKIPTLPPGKKFAIDRRHLQVVVVNQ
jgi:hypothetical protein